VVGGGHGGGEPYEGVGGGRSRERAGAGGSGLNKMWFAACGLVMVVMGSRLLHAAVFIFLRPGWIALL